MPMTTVALTHLQAVPPMRQGGSPVLTKHMFGWATGTAIASGGTAVSTSDLYGILVAVIGATGVVLSAIITQVLTRRRRGGAEDIDGIGSVDLLSVYTRVGAIEKLLQDEIESHRETRMELRDRDDEVNQLRAELDAERARRQPRPDRARPRQAPKRGLPHDDE